MSTNHPFRAATLTLVSSCAFCVVVFVVSAVTGDDAKEIPATKTSSTEIRRIGECRYYDKDGTSFQWASFTPDGKSLVGVASEIIVWNVSDGKRTRSISLPRGFDAVSCSLSPDGKLLAIGSKGKISVYDLSAQSKSSEFVVAVDVEILGWTPSNAQLLTWDHETVEFRNMPSGDVGQRLPVNGGACYCSKTDTLFIRDAKSGVVQTVRGQNGKRLGELPGIYPKLGLHAVSVNGNVIAFLGNRASPPSDAAPIVIVDAQTGKTIREFDAHYRGGILSPDGNLFASRGGQLFDIAKVTSKRFPISPLAFSPDVTQVVVAINNRLAIVETSTGKITEGAFIGTPYFVVHGGKRLVTSGWDGTSLITVWDLQSARLVATHEADNLSDAKGLPDGRVVIAQSTGRLTIWDPFGKSADKVINFVPHDQLQFLAISGDGTTIAMSNGASVLVYDAATRRLRSVPRIGGLGGGVVSLSERGGLIATCISLPGADSGGGVVAVDLESGRELVRTTAPSTETEWPLQFFDGDRYLMVCHSGVVQSPSVKVFEVATGQEAARVEFRGLDRGGPVIIGKTSRTLVSTVDGQRHIAIRCWDLDDGAKVNDLEVDPGGFFVGLLDDARSYVAIEVDRTIGVRQVEAPIMQNARAIVPPTDQQLLELWVQLAGRADRAFKAERALCVGGDRTVEFIKTHWNPPAIDEVDIRRWLTDIGSDNAGVRSTAMEMLVNIGPVALPFLNKMERDAPRSSSGVEELRSRLSSPQITNGDELRRIRSIAVLEWIGTGAAMKVLKGIADGPPAGRESKAAAQSLERLSLRLHSSQRH